METGVNPESEKACSDVRFLQELTGRLFFEGAWSTSGSREELACFETIADKGWSSSSSKKGSSRSGGEGVEISTFQPSSSSLTIGI